MKVDVLYCIEKRDINILLKNSIMLCIQNFTLLNDIYIVTNDVGKVNNFLQMHDYEVNIYVLDENDIIQEKNINGWYKQQLIKLKSYEICKTEYIACVGSDALIIKKINYDDLFYEGEQILYYNRYLLNQNHLDYERKRIMNLAEKFRILPAKSYLLGDFIMEFMIFKKEFLIELEEYVEKVIGCKLQILVQEMRSNNLVDKTSFGEWTLYAMFLLDVKKQKLYVKNSNSIFMEQIHSLNDLLLHNKEAKVVHCNDRELSLEMISQFLDYPLELGGE